MRPRSMRPREFRLRSRANCPALQRSILFNTQLSQAPAFWNARVATRHSLPGGPHEALRKPALWGCGIATAAQIRCARS